MAERTENRVDNEFRDDEPLLKAAVLDVSVPEGLDARIKSALRSRFPQVADNVPQVAGNVPLAADRSSVQQLPGDEFRTPAGTEEVGWLRRSMIALALAAGIFGFAFLANRWTRPAEPSWLARQCDLVLEKLEHDNPATWQKIGRDVPNIPQAVKSQLARVAFLSHRQLASVDPKLKGTLYRLDAGDGRGIILMKLEALPAVRGLTSRFEVLPTPSGGWSLAVMSIGHETYVLAAACTEQQIFAYIRRQALT